jgi:hypothetical protein
MTQQGSSGPKKVPGRPFKKGGDPRQAHVMAKQEEEECPILPPTGSSSGATGPGTSSAGANSSPLSEARRMRKVFEQIKTADKTPGEKALRGWLEKSPREYHVRMTELEAEEAARSAASRETPGTTTLDPGSKRCAELCDRLLAELT